MVGDAHPTRLTRFTKIGNAPMAMFMQVLLLKCYTNREKDLEESGRVDEAKRIHPAKIVKVDTA